jgi:hypothetical protein
MIQPPQQQPPAAPAAPAIAATPAPGARTAATPSAIYEGFRAQRRELTNQLEELEGTRRDISRQLEDIPAGAPERTALEARIKDVDSRISTVDQMLAGNAAQLSQAAAAPGAVIEQPPVRIVREGPPVEAMVGMLFLFAVFLPLSIAFARRIWRRGAAAVTSFPREIAERLQRMEHALEATAVEVERIGEGQRFLTRLFTEGESARAIGSGAAQPIEVKPAKASERLP